MRGGDKRAPRIQNYRASDSDSRGCRVTMKPGESREGGVTMK